MVVAVAYILSPIDFIPEVLLPLGVVDDATAFAWLTWAATTEISRHRQARQARQARREP